MNRKIKQLIFASIVLMSSGVTNAQLKADFVYEIKKELKTSDYFAFELKPFNLSFQGMFLGLGAGGKIQVADIGKKFSIAVDGTYNYINYSFDGNKLDYSSDPSEATTGTVELNASFGYTFISETKTETAQVRLKGNNRVSTVSNLPIKAVYRYSAHIGYSMMSLYSASEVITSELYTDELGNTFMSETNSRVNLKETNHNITIGAKRRRSVHNVYKTDKYGEVFESVENEIFGDILIKIASSEPDLYKFNYDSFGSYPNEIASAPAATPAERETLFSGFKSMPVGLRIGVRNGSRMLHGVTWQLQIALYPGRYATISNLVSAQMGISYRFLKGLK